eukprot:CAMPEP_0119394544 /NCGR_PEP_ID=MMETSP1334-20130426/129774_1 /TAXON_ID=127549 /ORGANISM="Calcidiscus leptoporus, Strain RCC1130" /LENGTH=106 /DNA_ID=CAMNT_0007417837 /DNA_START=440 /DNA_END=760 /DNA_ORIENTATION=-
MAHSWPTMYLLQCEVVPSSRVRRDVGAVLSGVHRRATQQRRKPKSTSSVHRCMLRGLGIGRLRALEPEEEERAGSALAVGEQIIEALLLRLAEVLLARVEQLLEQP